MGEIIEEIITDFTEGMTDDPRRTNVGLSQVVTNFDIFKNKKRMIPYAESENGDSSSSTSQKQNFDIGLYLTAWSLFSLGVVSGTGKAEILMKALGAVTSGDLSDATWTTPAGNQSASGTTSFELFKYYKTTGKVYGAKGGTTIWAFTPDGSTAFDDSHHSLAYTTIRQAIIHSKDDCVYIPYDNKIARNNAGTWTDIAIQVKSGYYIESIAEHENYIAIAAAPLSGVGKSIEYLWDRNASLTTFSESFDGGEGLTKIIESLNGDIVTVSLVTSSSYLRDRIIFRKYSGVNGFEKFAEFFVPIAAPYTVLLSRKQKFDNRVYFMASIYIDGVIREGLWSIGITKSGSFGIAQERTTNNDDTPVVFLGGALRGFFIAGDYVFIAYVDASINYAVSKTTNNVAYTATAIYESVIKNGNDSDIIKKLIGASVMFEPLPASAAVSLFYKKDSETVWLRLFRYSSENKISKGAVNLESDSNAFNVTVASPGVFSLAAHGLAVGQKIKLRTTGALPTGLTAGVEYFVLSSGLTSSVFKLGLTDGGSAINTSGTQSGVHTIDRTYNLTEGHEFKFRIESTGGAVITGMKYKMEILDKQLY